MDMGHGDGLVVARLRALAAQALAEPTFQAQVATPSRRDAIKVRVTFRRHLRTVTVQDDVGLRGYVRSVKSGEDDTSTAATGMITAHPSRSQPRTSDDPLGAGGDRWSVDRGI
jgi:hypothetical protein